MKTDLARALSSGVDSPREDNASQQIASAVVTEDTGANRFNMALEGGIAYATFRRQDGLLIISHTEVPRALRGRGIGSQLVHGIFELARRRGEKILPVCPFVADWAHRHPEYADLMPSSR
ncbi:GNAT family N-acetyltransferase [Bosea sp. BK604]|uniref:GNAT family N-acetyltransferase n=1 Tax=Bosea sp. BK604 TaxID=2512180 RepID=UPI0020C0B037|nr:GNAT family N-acetyltransferase [Bosea sp. BK604]